MRLDPHNAKAGRNALVVGLLMMTALNIGAASGLPDNPKDPPPPPSGAGYLFGRDLTSRVAREDNDVGTGIPLIYGVPELGNALNASKGTISDPQGTARADYGYTDYAYRYQWVRVDGVVETDIASAALSTYMLTNDDMGKAVKVKVWYLDDAGNPEGPRTSDTFNTSPRILVSNNRQSFNGFAGVYHVYGQQFTTGSNAEGYTLTAVGIYNHRPPSVIQGNLVTLNRSESNTEPGSVIVGLSSPDTIAWTSTNYFTPPPGTRLQPNTQYWIVVNDQIDPNFSNGNAEQWLKVFNTTSGAEDSESLADWRIANGYAWHDQLDEPWRKSNSVNMMMELRGVLGSLHVENYSATGAPSISGLAGAGRWLRASTSGIADNNSNSYAESDYYNFGYTYQWVRVDGGIETDIAGATDVNYLLTDDDLGRQVKVKVWFIDNAGNSEGPLASAAFPSGSTISPAGSPELGPPIQVLVENTSGQGTRVTGKVWAQRFTTGSNANGYKLVSVGIATGRPAGSDIKARIFTQSADNRPGTLVHTLTTPTAVAAIGVAFFPTFGDVTLSPNTNYFVVVTDSTGMDSTDVTFKTARNTGENSDLSEGWSIHNTGYWSYIMSETYWRSYSNRPMQMSVQGYPINP